MKIYQEILEELRKIVCKAGLVHGDLSEYNVMVKPDLDIVVIDVSQAVELSHPNAVDFLIRDIRNINRFFREEVGIEDIVDDNELFEGLKPCLEKIREG